MNEKISKLADAKNLSPVDVQPVAVIDIGTSSIRMAIAEISTAGKIRILDSFTQAVPLGKDTFKTGQIKKRTIENCVHVLKSYQKILEEFRISEPQHVRVVATSAVREAANKLAFIDRIYSSTGFDVETLDEAETNRITYLGVSQELAAEPTLTAAHTIIVEIGGGSTEVLSVQNGNVISAHSYRLGCLRLRMMIDSDQTSSDSARHIIENQIHRQIDLIQQQIGPTSEIELVAIGSDMRFAFAQINTTAQAESMGRIPLKDLQSFVGQIRQLSVDEIVQKYHLTYANAETIVPALLAYMLLAENFRVDHLLVSQVNLRDGLLEEMATGGGWTAEFEEQIIRSALELGQKFHFDEPHALHVAELSRSLFSSLQTEHQLDPRFELILYIAALLHETGLFIGMGSYHKHSMYLISNSEIFGLSKRALRLVSLVARYHRRASPKPSHSGYASLAREDRVAISKLSAILRVADALDESHSQRVKDIDCSRERNQLIITVENVEDLSLEQLTLRKNVSLFEEIFGLQVLLRNVLQ